MTQDTQTHSIQSMGGLARAKSLTKERMREIAVKSARRRWGIPESTPEAPRELKVPLGEGRFAVVQFPMTEEDYELLISTLMLWKRNLLATSSEPVLTAEWSDYDSASANGPTKSGAPLSVSNW